MTIAEAIERGVQVTYVEPKKARGAFDCRQIYDKIPQLAAAQLRIIRVDERGRERPGA